MSSQYGKLVRILAAFSVLAMILACDMNFDADTIEPTPVAEPATATDTADPAPAAAAGGGSCSRVAACCRAYVAAMGGSIPASTCDAYNNIAGMQDSMCDSTMAGYRSGLTAMQKAVPTECN